jgi:cytochrome c-type biogenesis protein CcmH/NrfG
LIREDEVKAVVWNRLGNVHRKNNEYDKAMAAYRNALKFNSEQADLVTRARFSLLGNCYVE